MAGDLHDVVQIHAGQGHEGSAGAAGGVAVDQLVLLNLFLLGRAAFGGLNLYQLRETCSQCNFLDVAVDDLAGQMRDLVVVFLQNGLQGGVAGNCDLGTGFLLANVQVGDLLLFNPCNLFTGIIWIGLLLHDIFGQCAEVLLLDIVVVRDTLRSPNANHEDVPGLLVSVGISAELNGHDGIQVFFGEVDTIHLSSAIVSTGGGCPQTPAASGRRSASRCVFILATLTDSCGRQHRDHLKIDPGSPTVPIILF